MKPLTKAMVRELRSIERTGEVSDLCEFGYNALAFYARDNVLSSALRQGFISSEPGGYVITEAGRIALAEATRGAK